jgi:hypothetical protein
VDAVTFIIIKGTLGAMGKNDMVLPGGVSVIGENKCRFRINIIYVKYITSECEYMMAIGQL